MARPLTSSISRSAPSLNWEVLLGRCQWVELHQSGRCWCNSDLTAVCFTKAIATNLNHHTITVAHLCGDNSWRSSGGTSSFLRKKSCTARLSGGLKVSTAHRPPIFRSFRAATKPARERTSEKKNTNNGYRNVLHASWLWLWISIKSLPRTLDGHYKGSLLMVRCLHTPSPLLHTHHCTKWKTTNSGKSDFTTLFSCHMHRSNKFSARPSSSCWSSPQRLQI